MQGDGWIDEGMIWDFQGYRGNKVTSFRYVLNVCGEAFFAGRLGNRVNHRNPLSRVQTLNNQSPFYHSTNPPLTYCLFSSTLKHSNAPTPFFSPGKLADITVLSKDIMTIPEDEILNTEIVYTIVGGKVLYQCIK